MPKILVADDHPLVREGLRRLLVGAGFSVVIEAQTGEEALGKAAELRPDLVIWDLVMPGGGLQGLQKLRQSCPTVKILAVTALDAPTLAQEVVRAGAQGLVAKTSSPEEIIAAVHAVLRGELFIPKEAALTAREQEVLALLGRGMRIPEIAEALGISMKTVESHLENIKGKLGCRSFTELRALAMRTQNPTDSPPQGPEGGR